MVMIEDFFYTDALPYAIIFLVFFAVLFFVLKRSVFKENKAVSTVIAVCLSLLIMWGLVNQTNLLDNLVYELGSYFGDLSSMLYTLILLGIILLIVLLIYKGLKKNMGKRNFPSIRLGLTALLGLIFASPYIMNIYYLPEWVLDYNWVFLILTIGMFMWTLVGFGKAKTPAKELGEEIGKGLRG